MDTDDLCEMLDIEMIDVDLFRCGSYGLPFPPEIWKSGCMFSIGRNFHIVHMTDDLPALDAWYDDVFSVVRYVPAGYADFERRDASLVLVGDLCIEPLAPAFKVEDWDKFPLGRFYSRFGRRWHSLAWFVPSEHDLREMYRALKAAKVRQFGTAGAKQDDDGPTDVIFTHPRDTFTQLEFMAGEGMAADPRHHPSYNPGWWTHHHPLGLTNSSHVTIVVRDMARARDLYVNLFQGRLLCEGEVALTETRSAFVAVGTDLVVELAQPLSSSGPLADDLAEFGENLYAVTYQVRDLAQAERHLASKGVKVARSDGITLLADPATTHGVVMGFTTRSIAGDVRRPWSSHPV